MRDNGGVSWFQTGGQPGGNIRNAILYNPQRVRLLPSEQGPGGATDSVEPILDDNDHLRLSHNPGKLDPTCLCPQQFVLICGALAYSSPLVDLTNEANDAQ